jgi:hypothetical protein
MNGDNNFIPKRKLQKFIGEMDQKWQRKYEERKRFLNTGSYNRDERTFRADSRFVTRLTA